MSARWWFSWLTILLIGSLTASSPSFAQDAAVLDGLPVDDAVDEPVEQSARAETSGAPPVRSADARPFSARLVVDSSMPINYGDDVVVSVWITPIEGIELKEVRLHPRGALASIYQKDEPATKDAVTSTDNESNEGVPCRVNLLNRPAGIPFLVSCRLTSNDSGFQRWFDADTLLPSGKQRVEAEIILQKGVDGTAIYFESAEFAFVSPKSAVILGGFFGALLWAFFLTISKPEEPQPGPPVSTWKGMFKRINSTLPDMTHRAASGLRRMLRSSLLGCAVALVLIVMAQTTEGFAPPISIRIQDFWGGMMIGILSVPLAKYIRGKLGAQLQ